ncbi:MAG: hypothetical protein ABSC53_03220 [Bacteroidota bacterium]
MNIFEAIDWKAIVAILALVLSQLPPIKQMIKGKKLRMAMPAVAQFTHVFGNTNLSIWLDFDNVGGKTVTVRRIEAILRKINGPKQKVIAKSYWITESLSHDKPTALFLGEIALKPGEKWSAFFNFYDDALWSRDIQSKVSSIKSKFREDINAKVSERDKKMPNVPQNERPLVEADRVLVEEVLGIVRDLKRLEQAEYELIVAAFEQSENSPLSILGFDFTLFENDVREIFDDTSDYKFGYGIHLSSTKTKYVTINLRPMNEEKVEKLFAELF